MHRIPTLDGWRGIAVILVLLFHFQTVFYTRFVTTTNWAWFGQHGVSIFFVLSGFLVTSQLISDKIDLRHFYIRRFFRLMPAAWVYLAAVVFFASLHIVRIGSDLWGCLFFYRNYIPLSYTNMFTSQLWSLSMEEQYYLLWPLVLMLVGRKVAPYLCVAGLVGVVIHRMNPAYWVSGRDLFTRTGLRVDAILVGCLLAFVMRDERVKDFVTRRSPVLFWGSLVIFLADMYRFQAIPPLHENVAIALMVASTATNPKLIASRLLELPHLKTTGLLCYGIYLWQGLFIHTAFGVFGIILLPIAVLGSWVLIEKPSQRLGLRLIHAGSNISPRRSAAASSSASTECT